MSFIYCNENRKEELINKGLVLLKETVFNGNKSFVFVNDKKLFHFSYERYLVNQLRKEFGLVGTPIRIISREKIEK